MSFFGFPYPTRMALVRLSDSSLWVWSPIALTDKLAKAVDSIGRVRCIVSPNKLHHLFLREWSSRWPDAQLYAPPGLGEKNPNYGSRRTSATSPIRNGRRTSIK
ncbi:MAG: DUF4336 domain-containing protein [Casimicrobiaceae bacterium]